MESGEHLRVLEERLLRTAVRRNATQVGELLAEDFREFGSSGRVYSKAEVMELLQDEEDSSWSLKNFEVRPLSPTLALVTYLALRNGVDGAQVESLRSSLWELRDGRWQMFFHQGTKIPAK